MRSNLSKNSYKDLIVWQRAVELSVAIYKLTATFPREEIYGLTNQLRRAGVFVASNIAEGYGRFSPSEYKNFLSMARGSVLEVQTQLLIAEKLAFAPATEIETTKNLSEEIGKMLWAIAQKL